ncbi:hypothetical protein KIPB_013602, partial [Kipferlia bialata]|eukprot:g13602.t1
MGDGTPAAQNSVVRKGRKASKRRERERESGRKGSKRGMSRKEKKLIMDSFTQADIHAYAVQIIASGIEAYSVGPYPLFPVEKSMTRRLYALIRKGYRVAFRCQG